MLLLRSAVHTRAALVSTVQLVAAVAAKDAFTEYDGCVFQTRRRPRHVKHRIRALLCDLRHSEDVLVALAQYVAEALAKFRCIHHLPHQQEDGVQGLYFHVPVKPAERQCDGCSLFADRPHCAAYGFVIEMVADDVRKHERNCGVEQVAHLERKQESGKEAGIRKGLNGLRVSFKMTSIFH